MNCADVGNLILITNKTIDKKSSHNPYTQDHAQFFVQFLIGAQYYKKTAHRSEYDPETTS